MIRKAARKKQTRLSPEARRQQLVDLAAKLLTERGVEAFEITEVAELAGVSRTIVYRFFPTKQAMVLAVLEDFEQELGQRFRETLFRTFTEPLAGMTGAFVEACCDAIETKGAGAWHLLDARGGDPEIVKLGQTIQERLLAPWYPRIADVTGLREVEVAMFARALAGAGRAILDFWIDGRITREAAVRRATQMLEALFQASRR